MRPAINPCLHGSQRRGRGVRAECQCCDGHQGAGGERANHGRRLERLFQLHRLQLRAAECAHQGYLHRQPDIPCRQRHDHLLVNTTADHKQAALGGLQRPSAPPWLAGGVSPALAGLVLLLIPRRKWRRPALLGMLMCAVALLAVGCGDSDPTEPGTPSGTYSVWSPASVAGTLHRLPIRWSCRCASCRSKEALLPEVLGLYAPRRPNQPRRLPDF